MSNLRFEAPIRNFEDAERFLGGRTAKELAYKTVVSRNKDVIGVYHHGTAIAFFSNARPIESVNGTPTLAMLRTGGWDTATTTRRLHMLIPSYAPAGLSIGITDGQTVARIDGYEYPFDSLAFAADGQSWAFNGGKMLRMSHATRDAA